MNFVNHLIASASHTAYTIGVSGLLTGVIRVDVVRTPSLGRCCMR